MKTVILSDVTLCLAEGSTFREKLEIARLLDNLRVDVIELPAVGEQKQDALLVRTIASFVKHAALSVAVGGDADGAARAAQAVAGIDGARLRVEAPVSPVAMEYHCHKKAPKMLEWIASAVAAASAVAPTEFVALDATRAEPAFLKEALAAAVGAGAAGVTLCDAAGCTPPDAFAAFVASAGEGLGVPVQVRCDDRTGLALAQAALALKGAASGAKTAVAAGEIPLEGLAALLRDAGAEYGLCAAVDATKLRRTVRQIERITASRGDDPAAPVESGEALLLDVNDDKDAVTAAAAALGYDLSEEDAERVYGAFCRVARKKSVGAKELEAILVSTALQVPAVYELDSYIVTSGNAISTSAQIALRKQDQILRGVAIGDGPIDAAFLAIEQVSGYHYDLDDFEIQTVTQGKEAVGSATVKLRVGGRIYTGNGVSTDIIEASVRAYIHALNKIVYEEVGA